MAESNVYLCLRSVLAVLNIVADISVYFWNED